MGTLHRRAPLTIMPQSRHAASPMTADLAGSERVRRHPHHRARSAPLCGVSCGPRAYRVRVPIAYSSCRRLCYRAERVDLSDLLKLAEIILLVDR